MRTMNYLLTTVLLLLVGACTKDLPAENEDLASTEYKSRLTQHIQEKSQEIFELDLHQYYVLGQLAQLERQKKELEEEIEGGDEKEIPVLEALMKQIKENIQALGDILENSCAYLKYREQQLLREVIGENKEARAELDEVRQKLRGCGLSLSGYLGEVMETKIMAIRVGGNIGGNCDPGIDFDRCVPKMGQGVLLINSIDGQGGGKKVYFKSVGGKIINEGKIVGQHSELKGVQQMAIELKPIKKGILEFKGRQGSFQQAVVVE